MSFKAIATDNCGISKLQIAHLQCYKYDKFGRRVDRTRTCGASVSGDTITIARPTDLNGIGDNVDWTVVANDKPGNSNEKRAPFAKGH